ncbi:MAG: glycosyltransferase family 2 protein [Chromatocurvus sp.]
MTTDDAPATICIVPRERYSLALASLDSVLGATPKEFPLVYVDGQSPPAISTALAARCRARGASYIQTDKDLPPNRARALALRQVTTPYVIFVDNDVFPGTNWASQLVKCAQETGAWAVSPLVMEGSAMLPLIHMAGGDLQEKLVDGVLTLKQSHRFMLRLRRRVRSQLQRQACGFFEFHCVLLRSDCFRRGCSLDVELTALHEHLDLAMQIHRAGGEVYFEPDAYVRYDNATPFVAADRDFFERRWSEDWIHGSLEHFRKKWGMASNDADLLSTGRWATRHRELFGQTQKPWLRRALPRMARREVRHFLQNLQARRRA